MYWLASNRKYLFIACLPKDTSTGWLLTGNYLSTDWFLTGRDPERWVLWDCGPSQFYVLAATFAYPARIAADSKWLRDKVSYQKLRLPVQIVFKPKNAIKGAQNNAI